jgi:hypothetical protein
MAKEDFYFHSKLALLVRLSRGSEFASASRLRHQGYVGPVPQHAHWLSLLSEFEDMREVPEMWMDYVILGSGSHDICGLS